MRVWFTVSVQKWAHSSWTHRGQLHSPITTQSVCITNLWKTIHESSLVIMIITHISYQKSSSSSPNTYCINLLVLQKCWFKSLFFFISSIHSSGAPDRWCFSKHLYMYSNPIFITPLLNETWLQRNYNDCSLHSFLCNPHCWYSIWTLNLPGNGMALHRRHKKKKIKIKRHVL